MGFRKRTVSLRRSLSLGFMRCASPKLATDVKNFLEYNLNIDYVPRPFTLFLKRHFSYTVLVGAEIGFGLGINAKSLLNSLNVKRLYCIDPHIFQPYVQNKKQILRYVNGERNFYFDLICDERVVFLRCTSDEAFRLYGNKLKDLDFVYVDGNHATSFVVRDLINSYRCIKVNGVVGGHDLTTQFENTVLPAIFDFAVRIKKTPSLQVPDYWFVKNG